MKINGVRVTPGQAAVHAVLKQYGPVPDHALVPLAQHVSPTHLSSSGIRSRRKELLDLKLVEEVGTTTTASNRAAGVFKAVG